MSLQSFSAPIRAAVIGASGGIGRAFAEALAEDRAVDAVLAFTRSGPAPAGLKIKPHHLDLLDEGSIKAAAETARETLGGVDLVIVATGILHAPDGLKPEKTWRQIDASAIERISI